MDHNKLDRIINYLMERYQFAKSRGDWELAAYYFNGARTVSLIREMNSVQRPGCYSGLMHGN